MVRPETIRKRLNKLHEYLVILEGLRKYSFDEFASDPEHYGSTERFLQLAIEAVTDVGSHIVSDENLGIVNWHSDIPEILASKNIITDSMKETWIMMIGFRNTIVHDYLDIDRHIVFDVLHNNLKDFREFETVFAKFL